MSDWGTRPVAATSVNHTRVCARLGAWYSAPLSLIPSSFPFKTFEPDLRSEGEGRQYLLEVLQ